VFLVPHQKALGDPETAHSAKHNASSLHSMLQTEVLLCIRDDNKMSNFVCIHTREDTNLRVKKVCCGWAASLAKFANEYWQDWSNDMSTLVLLEVYQDFDPALLKLLSKVSPESLKAWELLDVDVLLKWIDKRLALLGDAAYPFLPLKPTLTPSKQYICLLIK
jgi:2-polyprenyl-6-methoxyphenol hydroxylase-like FAD-dependent oxidoreductase